MTKLQFVDSFAEKTGLTKAEAKKAVEAFLSTTTETLSKGEKLSFPGFGTWEVVHKKATTGINPSTKEKIDIPARNVVKFRVGSNLKKSV